MQAVHVCHELGGTTMNVRVAQSIVVVEYPHCTCKIEAVSIIFERDRIYGIGHMHYYESDY